ncbi:hypothetical protein [Kocuria rosea]|nr:hypothetical protein [Kocuria polaris]
MPHSTDRIRTTHAGSLPRTPAPLGANRARGGAELASRRLRP